MISGLSPDTSANGANFWIRCANKRRFWRPLPVCSSLSTELSIEACIWVWVRTYIWQVDLCLKRIIEPDRNYELCGHCFLVDRVFTSGSEFVLSNEKAYEIDIKTSLLPGESLISSWVEIRPLSSVINAWLVGELYSIYLIDMYSQFKQPWVFLQLLGSLMPPQNPLEQKEKKNDIDFVNRLLYDSFVF